LSLGPYDGCQTHLRGRLVHERDRTYSLLLRLRP
jgi:hypothetical protein